MHRWALLIALCQAVTSGAEERRAEEPPNPEESTPDLRNRTLEELMEIEVQVASRTPVSQVQAPSIVTVITRSEIEVFGARDAVDILRMVPGFEFGMDATGVLGAGMRGIWVHEGKMLLMINGVTYNDLGFGNVNFFGTIPASVIERVEIVRGPGSAVFGGFAEVVTVNFITVPGAQLQGARVSGHAGTFFGGAYTRDLNASVGARVGEVELAAHLGYLATPLSRRVYRDFFGGELQLGEQNSLREWRHLLLEAKVGGLTLNYNRALFVFAGQDAFINILPQVNGRNTELNNNVHDGVQARYSRELVPGLRLEGRAKFISGTSIGAPRSPLSPIGEFALSSLMSLQRMGAEVSGSYEIPSAGRVALGVGYLRDNVRVRSTENEPGLQLSPDPEDLAFSTFTDSTFVFGEYVQQFGPVALTAGVRGERTTFGDAVAPRLGLTLQQGALNAKLLYGRAYRIPLPFQIYSRLLAMAGNVRPETANTVEGELGYRFGSVFSARANAFFIDVREPITFLSADFSYQNFGRIQSVGVEGELQARFPGGSAFLNASWARPGTATSRAFVTEDRQNFLGLPPVKVNLGAHRAFGRVQVAPSVTVLSPRSAQTKRFAEGLLANPSHSVYESGSHPAQVLLNLNLRAVEVVPGLDLSLSGHNLLGSDYVLLQPYYGGHAALPAHDREIRFGLELRI